jgi:hypothetical protein
VTLYSLGEFHKFQGAGQDFLYLVPSGGIVALEGITLEILQTLERASSAARSSLPACAAMATLRAR